MNSVLAALKIQLDTAISYCHDSGYIAEDVLSLIQSDKFPFYSLEPGSMRIGQIESIPIDFMERRVYNVTIVLGEQSLDRKIAVLGSVDIKGLYPFINDVLAAVIADRTLGGAVTGTEIDFDISTDVFEFENKSRVFVAGAGVNLSFYKDVVL